jgi:RNA polymerase sigma factor (sigma-70 family)
MTDSTFADLLVRARQGDNDAMMELIRHYEPEIRRVAHARLGPLLRPYLGSIDIVQSVHRSMIGQLRKNKYVFTRQKDLTAFAVTLVIRRISHAWRKLRTEEKVLRLVETLMKSRAAVEDPTASVEREDMMRKLIEQLTDSERRLLDLYLAGQSTKEIAQSMGPTENVVRARKSKLFKKLREVGVDPEALA